jgi:hypothetical protein
MLGTKPRIGPDAPTAPIELHFAPGTLEAAIQRVAGKRD